MTKDKKLEELSNNVRMGVPISIAEAKAVIEYQDKLRQWRMSLP